MGAPRGRVASNMAALRTLAQLDAEQRPASPEEQQVLARWASWGAVPGVFDESRPEFAATRQELRELLTEQEYRAAERTTINAHYTDHGYATAMWEALEALGVRQGMVLEPGCGNGVFMGSAPPQITMTGVELDPVTARIAQHLYPQATLRNESFADTPLGEGTFDAVIGNVPFGDMTLYDPRHNPNRHSIHNHFLIKSVALTRPGGYVVSLTSRFTLDSLNAAARRDLHAEADLIGAVRLPTGAHRAVAGTDAITDVLVLRRRLPGEPPAGSTWLSASRRQDEEHEYTWNDYFTAHPDRVLGELRFTHGQYGSDTLRLESQSGEGHVAAAVTAQLRKHLGQIAAEAPPAPDSTGIAPAGQAPPPKAVDLRAPARVPRVGDPTRYDGYTTYDQEDGVFRRTVNGVPQTLDVPKAQAPELRQLLGLRDLTTELLTLEAANPEDTPDLAAVRARLNSAYTTYLDRYGPINRVKISQSTRGAVVQLVTDDEDNTARESVLDPGKTITRRTFPGAVRTFKADPFAPPVMALESYDEVTHTATKAAIFTERVVAPRTPRTSAANPRDALAITLDTVGAVDLQHVASLLGSTPEQARQDLTGLVYHDPATDELVTAEEYLSGDVRAKLDLAQAAVIDHPDLQANIDALQDAQPADLGPDEIDVRLGAPWVPDTDVSAFLKDVLNDSTARAEHAGGSTWDVTGSKWSVAATSTWGTDRMDAIGIVGRLLQQKTVIVRDLVIEGETERRVVNADATAAAQEKAEALNDRFSEWVWEDPARAARLAETYNRTFNAIRLREYATEHMTFPGLARTFTPMRHQKVAVARMVAEPAVGLFHEVGAGKTAEMVMGVQELRRLGLVRKPAIVVPNHMLEQFAREFLQLYPQANILAAGTDDLSKNNRRLFVAKIATGDWDAVVMTRGAFQRLPVSRQAVSEYQERALESLRAQLERAREHGTKSLTIKGIQKAIVRAEEQMKANLDAPRDQGITFEQTGIDYLCIDELHDYKNLPIPSNIEGVTTTGVNKRASDLDMKIEVLRHAHGDRVVTGATATPIANSVSEAYVMQRYLRPDLLRNAGITDFDSWAASFGAHVTDVELAPEGGGSYRTTTRFARFRNVPEMLRLWHSSADIKTAEDLDLPRPDLAARADGQRVPEVVAITPSPELTAYVQDLGERAEAIRNRMVTPDVDNMLKVSHDGRSAALDMRLVGVAPDNSLVDVPTKVDVAAARIHRLWAEHKNDPFTVPGSDEPSPNRGALQLVFCDLGTPGPDKDWSVYDELRTTLVGHGMDPARVRFMHEAKNDAEKARLFAACRNGDVDVIIGSTQRMGVGTNIQHRAIAAHHLDCPWRPADVAQRDGRVLRQGNQNPEVQILRYVVEGSFDAYMWQAVERKSKFIAQVMKGSLDSREIEDIGDAALSFNEIKAIASGDPRILDLAQAQQDLTKLERLERAHQRNQTQLRFEHSRLASVSDALQQDIPLIEEAVSRRRPTAGEVFAMTVDGQPFTARSDAAAAIRRTITPHLGRLNEHRPTYTVQGLVGLGGHDLDVTLSRSLGRVDAWFSLRDVPVPSVQLRTEDFAAEGHGIVTKLENAISRLDQNLTDKQARLVKVRSEIRQAKEQIGQPFPRAADLADARTRYTTLADEMNQRVNPRPAQAPRPSDSSGITTTPEEQQAINVRGLAKVRAAIKTAQERGDSTQPQRHVEHHPQHPAAAPSPQHGR